MHSGWYVSIFFSCPWSRTRQNHLLSGIKFHVPEHIQQAIDLRRYCKSTHATPTPSRLLYYLLDTARRPCVSHPGNIYACAPLASSHGITNATWRLTRVRRTFSNAVTYAENVMLLSRVWSNVGLVCRCEVYDPHAPCQIDW